MTAKSTKQNKENRAITFSSALKMVKPTHSTDTDELDLTSTSTKVSKSKRKPSSRSTSRSRSKPQVEEEEDAEEEEEVVAEETQEEVMRVEKPTKKGSIKKLLQTEIEDEDDVEMTPREKRFKTALDLTTTALNEVKLSFTQLRELRITKAEESEKSLTDLAAQRQATSLTTLQSLKTENDQLRLELSQLKTSKPLPFSPSRSSLPPPTTKPSPPPTSTKELETKLKSLEGEKLAWMLKEKEWEGKMKKRDEKWAEEVGRTVRAKDAELEKAMKEVRAELATATLELTAEITHSKSLQAKLASSSSSHQQKPSMNLNSKQIEEITTLKTKLMLNEDLTGLSIHSVKVEVGDDPGVPTYGCVLTDCLGRAGSLPFKISFREDGSACYDPDVDPERDPILFELLPEQFRSFMRFRAEDCGKWFRTLFRAVNRIAD